MTAEARTRMGPTGAHPVDTQRWAMVRSAPAFLWEAMPDGRSRIYSQRWARVRSESRLNTAL